MNNDTSPSLFPNLESTMRKAWLQLFGSMIQEIRENAGRTLEEASQLAGMFSLEWAAIEAGYIPADQNRIHSMADVLGIPFGQLESLAVLCQGAWQD